MTWKMTLRGDSTAPISAEYECPLHGRFIVTVPRPAPGAMPCPELCPPDDKIRLLHECMADSPWRFPTPIGRVRAGEMVRGKTGELPPDHIMMDTSCLADGMPIEEFKARRAKVHRDESLRRVRALRSR